MSDEQIVQAKKLDQDQSAVCNADSNVVVTAGAGSGKTTVLAERYVRLVCEKNIPVDKILTLTFTRKAASEMYSRIYQRLSESNHKNAAEQLKRFDQARISTLDSFCTLICRGASYRYGIAPNFKMDETELVKIAEDIAVEIIMKYRDEDVIHNIVSSRSFDDVVKKIFADIGTKHISIVGNNDFEKLAEKQIIFLESEINLLWKQQEELCNHILSINNDTNNASVEKAKSAVKDFPEFQNMNNDILRKLKDISMFIKSGNSFRMPASNVKNAALVELRDYAEPLKKLSEKMERILETYSFKEHVLQLGIILNDYALRFQNAKRTKGILSFADTAELAVAILHDDHTLRTFYKNQFDAIMIDEFQDNNQLQKDLLYLLSERQDFCNENIPAAEDLSPDKLFFVGDEKQSIYRFRGADVSVFRGLSLELKNSVNKESQKNPVNMALQTNYRSHPELVHFFNLFFAEVFEKTDYLFDAEYSSMLSGQTEKKSDETCVEIYLQEIVSAEKTDDDNEENDTVDAASSEAVHVAERIVRGVASGEFLFGDVAILFRSTTRQNYYERCFREIGIPFNAADPRGIFAEALINDFYAMLRLALFHQDTNSYAAVLRSPFVRIGDETFLRIMLGFSENPFPENPSNDWFHNESDKARYEQGRMIFQKLQEKIDVEEIPQVISFLWYETPYRTDVLNNPETFSILEHFDVFYNLAIDAAERKLNMVSFLDELALQVGTYNKLESSDPVIEENSVTLMTVHKSKGLEFKVVIIADSDAQIKQRTEMYFLSDDFGPLVNMKSVYESRDKAALNYIYEIGKEEDRLKSEAELKRLFYVASTRAEERLIIFGSRKINKDIAEQLSDLDDDERLKTLLRLPRINSTKKAEYKNSFMDLLYVAINKMYGKSVIPNWNAKAVPLLGLSDEKNMCNTLRSLVKQLQSKNNSWKNLMQSFFNLPEKKYSLPKKRIVNPSTLEIFESSSMIGKQLPPFACGQYLTNDNLKKIFGTLCHFVIEKHFLHEDLENHYDNIKKMFASENIKPQEIKIIFSSAIECAEKFLASDFGRKAFHAQRCETEYPFYLPFHSDESESIMVKGTIDLIFESDNECIIIDFKTDQYLKPEMHQVQMDTYRLAAESFSDLPVKIFLVYLRSMETVPINQVLTKENLFAAMEEKLKPNEIGFDE
jgi:ATP-dependent helicase/nuclease subunit A